MLRPTTDRTRPRARHRWARGAFLRLEVLALVVVAICLAVLSSSSAPARADLELTSGPGDSLTLSNDKEGAAILSLGGMRPGDSVTDTVTLGNTGTVPGDLSLSTSNLLDTPGTGGGALSGKLDLVIRDVTMGSPVTVYTGKLDALTPVTLGPLAAGASRVYEFSVSFPDAGIGAENAFQGSAVSVQFNWTAVNNDADTDPPETTITAGPATLSASPDATFAFTSDESGSTFECSLDGSAFATCSSPATYTGLGDGAHTFDVRATDSSANTDATPAGAAWTIDATGPNVSLENPGSPVRGTVSLSPSADDGTGSGVATLIVQRSPAGAGTWTTIGTNWNTASGADGSYDLRARATDNAGNSANSALRTVTVDNTAPTVSSSLPADGSLVPTAGTLTVGASEDVAGIANATLDDVAAPAPLVAGATVTYTSTFDDGPHTLAGELEDLAGNRTPIRIHFTVWNLAAADYPWVEKNSFPTVAMTLPATNGDAAFSVPAGAWSGAPAGDWLVVRVDPRPPATLSGGFETAGDIYDVTAYWALDESAVHTFTKALDLTIEGAGTIVPATFESGAWRAIAPIPSGQNLPSGWQDGFYRSGSEVHILTKHLSSFSLLKDVQSPTKPRSFSGSRSKGRLVLKWKAATDNGVVSAYLVYVNGKVVRTLGASARSVDMGRFKSSDSRSFGVAARDSAGNVGAKTRTLVVVPSVAKLLLSEAKTRLAAGGLRAGAVSYAYSATIAAGRVISARTGVAFKGAAVALQVSRGPSGRNAYSIPTATSGGTGSGGTSYGGTNYGGTPTVSPFSPGSTPTQNSSGEGSPAPTESGDPSGVGGVEPQSYIPADDDTTSPLRRLLGLALLGGAFAAAGGVALRARRPRHPRPAPSGETVEPLLFWDDRLVHAVTTSVRRFTGRL
jgi:hypothetical protein